MVARTELLLAWAKVSLGECSTRKFCWAQESPESRVLVYRLTSSPDAGTTSASNTCRVARTVPCREQRVLVRAGIARRPHGLAQPRFFFFFHSPEFTKADGQN